SDGPTSRRRQLHQQVAPAPCGVGEAVEAEHERPVAGREDPELEVTGGDGGLLDRDVGGIHRGPNVRPGGDVRWRETWVTLLAGRGSRSVTVPRRKGETGC